MDAEKDLGEPPNKHSQGEQRGAIILYFTLQIIFFVIFYYLFIPLLSENKIFYCFCITVTYYILLKSCDFIVKKFSDAKIEGFTSIFVGFFLVTISFEDLFKSIIVATGISLIVKGSNILSLESHPLFNIAKTFYSLWIDLIKK